MEYVDINLRNKAALSKDIRARITNVIRLKFLRMWSGNFSNILISRNTVEIWSIRSSTTTKESFVSSVLLSNIC